MNTLQVTALANFREFVSTEMVGNEKYYHFKQLVELVDGKVTQFHRDLLAHKEMQSESKSLFGDWYVSMKFVRFLLLSIDGERAGTLYKALLASATADA